MGRKKAKQSELWVSTDEITRPASHPLYSKVNEVLTELERDFHRGKVDAANYFFITKRPISTYGHRSSRRTT